jgi:hypothetical protein
MKRGQAGASLDGASDLLTRRKLPHDALATTPHPWMPRDDEFVTLSLNSLASYATWSGLFEPRHVNNLYVATHSSAQF